jgi:hypothetical protein
MKRLLSISFTVFILICMIGATERTAYAYVDPGSGLLALQSFAAVAASFGYVMRRKIRTLFRGNDVTKSELPVSTKEGNSANAA